MRQSKNEHTKKFGKCNKCGQRRYINEFNECKSCERCKRCNDRRRDYLNKFQVCNLCYIQMEREIPSGFKPNVKSKICKRCNQRKDYLNKFQLCNLCYIPMEREIPSGFKPNVKSKKCKRCNQRNDYLSKLQICSSCISGNKVIDDFIAHNKIAGKMEFVLYNRFKDVKFVAEGGFSKIFRATWIDGQLTKCARNGETIAVLKELKNSKNINSKELNELKIYCKLALKKNDRYISKYHGFTQDPITKNFMIIMDYYEFGDLTHHITNNFFNISWLNKLYILDDIISGHGNLHKQNIIHKDYHSGNIFLTESCAMTGDLGISKSAITDDNDEIYGIIPYMAPEIFQRQKYTKASDIYSFGMIMWELMTGKRPFWNQGHDTDLIIKICDGIRPPIFSNIHVPEGYIELMQECWHPDPLERPTAVNLTEKIKTMRENEYINSSGKNNPTKIIKSPDIELTANDPDAIYKSRSLSELIKSAEFTGSLKSQEIGSICYHQNNFNDKKKFGTKYYLNKIVKKIKLYKNKNNDYLTKELWFDIDNNINSHKSNHDNNNVDYVTKEIDFDI